MWLILATGRATLPPTSVPLGRNRFRVHIACAVDKRLLQKQVHQHPKGLVVVVCRRRCPRFSLAVPEGFTTSVGLLRGMRWDGWLLVIQRLYVICSIFRD